MRAMAGLFGLQRVLSILIVVLTKILLIILLLMIIKAILWVVSVIQCLPIHRQIGKDTHQTAQEAPR